MCCGGLLLKCRSDSAARDDDQEYSFCFITRKWVVSSNHIPIPDSKIASVDIHFLLKSNVEIIGYKHGGRHSASKFILCWVDDNNRLHHFYTITPGVLHVESSYTGHAFLILRLTPGCKLPFNGQQVRKRDIICSYMPTEAPSKGCVHMVSINLVWKNVHVSEFPIGESPSFLGSDCRLDIQLTSKLIPKPDDEYRVIVRAPCGSNVVLPDASQGWSVWYQFVCPPYPTAPSFNPTTSTFYVWGDLHFASASMTSAVNLLCTRIV